MEPSASDGGCVLGYGNRHWLWCWMGTWVRPRGRWLCWSRLWDWFQCGYNPCRCWHWSSCKFLLSTSIPRSLLYSLFPHCLLQSLFVLIYFRFQNSSFSNNQNRGTGSCLQNYTCSCFQWIRPSSPLRLSKRSYCKTLNHVAFTN